MKILTVMMMKITVFYGNKMIVFILIIITIMVMISNIDRDNIKILQFRYHYIDINSKHSNNL